MNLNQLKFFFRQKIKVKSGEPIGSLTRGEGVLAVLDALAEEVKKGTDPGALSQALRSLVIAAPYTNDEAPAPAGTLLGQRFFETAYRYEAMLSSDEETIKWIRTPKGGGSVPPASGGGQITELQFESQFA